MRPVLVQLSYSPWSEKARWALDHHHVDYVKIEHVPMVFEPLLRIASREPFKKQSVPKLFHDSKIYGDSLTIARHAEEIGTGSRLFSETFLGEILAWADRSEAYLSAARARMMQRLLSNPAALVEATPGPLKMFGPVAFATTKLASRFVQKKHVKEGTGMAEHEATMVSILETLAKAIAKGDHLAVDFSFADIAMASMLAFLDPRPETPVGPEWRELLREPQLAAAFPQVLSWRDRMYEAHR